MVDLMHKNVKVLFLSEYEMCYTTTMKILSLSRSSGNRLKLPHGNCHVCNFKV